MSDAKGNFLWPSVATLEGARKATLYGVWAAGFSAVVTGLAATYAVTSGNKAFGSIDAWAYVDAVIFAAIAFGIFREKRWVAVFGLAFFLLEKVFQFVDSGQLRGAWMAVILVLCYCAAVRGTYALHKLRQGAAPATPAPPPGPTPG